MKKKGFIIVQPAIVTVTALTLCLVLILSFTGCAKDKISDLDGVEDPELTYTNVQVIEEKSDKTESSYRVGTALSGTDFSAIGEMLTEKLAQEWNTYDSMTQEAKLVSSHIWGLVYFETDTWKECEEAIGVTVNNPLESLSWLNMTGHIGMESAILGTPIKHIRVIVNAANDERTPSEISVTAGYSTVNARITLTATLVANAETYATGMIYNGYATYEHNTVTTKSGIPVLIVTTNGTNNNDYYHGDFYDPTAYWVKDNVFYTLRVFGNATDKADMQAALDRILAEI